MLNDFVKKLKLIADISGTLLSSSPLACTVARAEQQTRADELDKPAL